jgi:hypothetical protein
VPQALVEKDDISGLRLDGDARHVGSWDVEGFYRRAMLVPIIGLDGFVKWLAVGAGNHP